MRLDALVFESEILGRWLPLTVLLPPGYDAADYRYPVLYMLHGLSSTNEEWLWYGIDTTAGGLMSSGELPPFIIVLPQGDDGYWMDHAYGGPSWGQYVAREVVALVDARYRTLQTPRARAVGGLSMGADGAVQLALNFPDVFGIAGAHSPVFRTYDIAPTYYGDRAYFEAHYPPALTMAHPEVARSLAISIDVGDADEWLANARGFHDLLTSLGIEHRWQVWPGVHNADYWAQHLPDNLRFYAAAFGDNGPP